MNAAAATIVSSELKDPPVCLASAGTGRSLLFSTGGQSAVSAGRNTDATNGLLGPRYLFHCCCALTIGLVTSRPEMGRQLGRLRARAIPRRQCLGAAGPAPCVSLSGF